MFRSAFFAPAPALVLIGLLAACGDSGDSGLSEASATPASSRKHTATVLLDAGYAGSWPTGLDPATNLTARANLNQMNAIYGGLFQLVTMPDGESTEVAGILAEGYDILDGGRTIAIRIREGARFSDGTAFDAYAVKFNIERNLASPCTCAPTIWPWADEKVSVVSENIVHLHFTRPYSAVMHAFPIANINWIASPAALELQGAEEFRISPVGAGPFRIVSNQPNTRLVLERNPFYFDRNSPHLDELIFQTIGSEQAAIQALVAGDAQAYLGLTSMPLLQTAMRDPRIVVSQQPGTAPYVIQLNTLQPPFNDPRAREAIYFATDVEAILEGLFDNAYPISESFTGPGGLFFQQRVPGYRHFDLDRARAIVDSLGGIEVRLGTVQSFVAEQVITALKSQWEDAGMNVSIETFQLSSMIEHFQSGAWQAMLTTAGSYDPESSGGVSFRFRSDQPYTGVKDPELDQLLINASMTQDLTDRGALYARAARLISDNAYAPFLFAFAPAQLTTGGLEGPGLTTTIPPILVNTGVLWQDVKYGDSFR